MKISVIIPCLNEAESLPVALGDLASAETEGLEVIVADGGSDDASVAIADELGARTTVSPRGRGRQMNAGAALATGDVILFLHADTRLGRAHLCHIESTLANPNISHGSFGIQIDRTETVFRLLSAAANLRTRLDRTAYGDQGIYVRRAAFEEVSGYPEVPIMEDVMLARRLRRTGGFSFSTELRVRTSARRWQRRGLMQTTLMNGLTRTLWELGVSPERLRRLYDLGNRASTVTGDEETAGPV